MGPDTNDPNGWDGGNLETNYNAGGLLIVQENAALSSPPTYGTGPNAVTSASNYDPDDNVGGTITFTIDSNNFDYNFFRATLADFEAATEEYEAVLYGVGGEVETFSFADFVTPGDPNFDPSLTSGDNHINLLPVIALSNQATLTQVDINFIGTSGSVSGIIFSNFSIPEPSTYTMLGLTVLGSLLRRRC